VTTQAVLEATGVSRAALYRYVKDRLIPGPVATLRQRGRGGNNPKMWDISVIERIRRLKASPATLPK